MYQLSTILVPSAGRILLLTICVSAVSFLIWFLVALLLDDIRMREAQRSAWSRSAAPSAATRLHPIQIVHGDKRDRAVRQAPLSGLEIQRDDIRTLNASRPRISIFRLPDKSTEKEQAKLRWLLMALLLSPTFRPSAQTADSGTQQPAPALQAQTSKPRVNPLAVCSRSEPARGVIEAGFLF